MDPKLQRRIQRYGWDLAAHDYEDLWREQLAPARAAMFGLAALMPGERVLDVACGTGMVTFEAARAVGPAGATLGVDLSGEMIAIARQRAARLALPGVHFERTDAEALALPDAQFDVALCSLGLMYFPDPHRALCEMLRVLRPGGRMVLTIWGDRARCGWSPVFEIVEAEVTSEVCPLFFSLGHEDTLARLCARAGFESIAQRRVDASLRYANVEDACDAAFVGGPVALAWSRFDTATRMRVRERYGDSIEPWRNRDDGSRYGIPGEFVVVSALAPAQP